MSAINIKVLNQLKDNYSYLLHNRSGDASVIDPAESFPIIEYVKKYNWPNNVSDLAYKKLSRK